MLPWICPISRSIEFRSNRCCSIWSSTASRQWNQCRQTSARSGHSDDEPALLVCVRDHGTGVKPADEVRLFAPFYSSKAKGLGLGLPISRSIVEAHGGRLSLVPGGGAGAAFQILLPLPALAIA